MKPLLEIRKLGCFILWNVDIVLTPGFVELLANEIFVFFPILEVGCYIGWKSDHYRPLKTKTVFSKDFRTSFHGCLIKTTRSLFGISVGNASKWVQTSLYLDQWFLRYFALSRPSYNGNTCSWCEEVACFLNFPTSRNLSTTLDVWEHYNPIGT